MLDLLIRGGWVADGSGSSRFPAGVAIDSDHIVEVARHPLEAAQAKRVIDAKGKIVCPGFFDVNGHSEWTVCSNPTQESTVRQGVTTEVVGNCGNGFAPVSDVSRAFIAARLRMYAYDGPVDWTEASFRMVRWIRWRGRTLSARDLHIRGCRTVQMSSCSKHSPSRPTLSLQVH